MSQSPDILPADLLDDFHEANVHHDYIRCTSFLHCFITLYLNDVNQKSLKIITLNCFRVFARDESFKLVWTTEVTFKPSQVSNRNARCHLVTLTVGKVKSVNSDRLLQYFG